MVPLASVSHPLPAAIATRPDSKAVSKVGYSKLILTFRIPNILSIILRLKLTSLK